MPSMLAEFLAAVLRHVLTGAAGYFVAKQILTPDQSHTMMIALVGWLLTVGWSLYNKIQWSKLTAGLYSYFQKGTTPNAK